VQVRNALLRISTHIYVVFLEDIANLLGDPEILFWIALPRSHGPKQIVGRLLLGADNGFQHGFIFHGFSLN
jgi:hypothetical protein